MSFQAHGRFTRPLDRGGRRIAIAIITVLIVCGALGTPLVTLGLRGRGSLLDLGTVVGAVLAAFIGGWRWWRLLPRPLLALGVIQSVLTIASVPWAAERSGAVRSLVGGLVGLALAILVVGASTHLRSGWRPLLWLGPALLVPCLLLWCYVVGFLPPVLTTTPHPWATLAAYFSRLSHPFYGPSNNIAALFVPLVVPLLYVMVKVSVRAGIVPFLLVIAALAATLSRGGLISVAASVAVWFVVARATRKRSLILLVPAVIVAFAAAWFVLYPHPGIDAHLTKSYLPATIAHTPVDLRAALTQAGEGGAESSTISSGILLGGRSGVNGLDNGRFALLKDGLSQVNFLGRGAGYDLHVHNTFLQQFVDFGFIGGSISVLAMLAFAWYWIRLVLRNRQDLAALAIGCGVIAQLASFILESSYEGDLLRRAIWLEWGVLVGAYLALRRRETAAHERPGSV